MGGSAWVNLLVWCLLLLLLWLLLLDLDLLLDRLWCWGSLNADSVEDWRQLNAGSWCWGRLNGLSGERLLAELGRSILLLGELWRGNLLLGELWCWGLLLNCVLLLLLEGWSWRSTHWALQRLESKLALGSRLLAALDATSRLDADQAGDQGKSDDCGLQAISLVVFVLAEWFASMMIGIYDIRFGDVFVCV